MPTLLCPFALGTSLAASDIDFLAEDAPTGIALERGNDVTPFFMLTDVTRR